MMIYSYIGVVLLVIALVFFILRFKTTKIVQSKEEKREEIIEGYKKQLRDALSPLQDNNEARVAKKMALLKKFNSELASNIFFDNREIQQIILELSKEG